ncbi:hypothetical protein EDD15DRAFT_2469607, partial [Pisolithus albus]
MHNSIVHASAFDSPSVVRPHMWWQTTTTVPCKSPSRWSRDSEPGIYTIRLKQRPSPFNFPANLVFVPLQHACQGFVGFIGATGGVGTRRHLAIGGGRGTIAQYIEESSWDRAGDWRTGFTRPPGRQTLDSGVTPWVSHAKATQLALRALAGFSSIRDNLESSSAQTPGNSVSANRKPPNNSHLQSSLPPGGAPVAILDVPLLKPHIFVSERGIVALCPLTLTESPSKRRIPMEKLVETNAQPNVQMPR